jgi:hypothetical protein
MQLDPDHRGPDAPLWPFVAIPQRAFIKGRRDVEGGALHHGGLMAKAEPDEIRESLVAGQESEILLRGITSRSCGEEVAVDFARKAKPLPRCLGARHTSYTRCLFSTYHAPNGSRRIQGCLTGRRYRSSPTRNLIRRRR